MGEKENEEKKKTKVRKYDTKNAAHIKLQQTDKYKKTK